MATRRKEQRPKPRLEAFWEAAELASDAVPASVQRSEAFLKLEESKIGQMLQESDDQGLLRPVVPPRLASDLVREGASSARSHGSAG